MRLLALACAVALLGAGDPSAGRYFTGSWKCAGTSWTFAPLADGSSWTRVTYGGAQPDGVAVMGYVSSLHAWVYRDFHANGSYADLTSPGPSDGRWQWTGPYYPSEGGPPLNGRITYVEVSPTRYDRTFEMMRSDTLVPMGGDSCTKVTP